MLNKVTLIGNLGADPDSRYMPNGGQVVTLSLATQRRWKDKSSGERKEHTEWHRVVMFNKIAEIAAEYLKKGSQLYIEGRLQTRKWTDNNGIDRYTTEIVADQMHMLGSKGQQANAASPSQPPPPTQSDEAYDDDVPF